MSFGIRLNQERIEKCHCRLFNLFTLFRSYNDTSEPTELSVLDVPTSTEGEDSNTSATANPSYDAQNVNPTNSDTNNNPAVHQSRIITVHRGNVRKDLIAIFQDPSIMNCHIIVEMLNERGIAEKGRGSGVFKDTLSLFWKDVYDSLMLGEGELTCSIYTARLSKEAMGSNCTHLAEGISGISVFSIFSVQNICCLLPSR